MEKSVSLGLLNKIFYSVLDIHIYTRVCCVRWWLNPCSNNDCCSCAVKLKRMLRKTPTHGWLPTRFTNFSIESTKYKNSSVKITLRTLGTKKQPFFFSVFVSSSIQVLNIPGVSSFLNFVLISWGCRSPFLSGKSQLRTYSRTNKVAAPQLLPRGQQASQITYTSVFSPRSQYVLILPLPWKKNAKINKFINGKAAEGDRKWILVSVFGRH